MGRRRRLAGDRGNGERHLPPASPSSADRPFEAMISRRLMRVLANSAAKINLEGAFAKMQSRRDAFVGETDEPKNVGLSGRDVKRCSDGCCLDHYSRRPFFVRLGIDHGAPQ
jgi:hypothetical protein